MKYFLYLVSIFGVLMTATQPASAQTAIGFVDASDKLEFQDVYVESWGVAWGDLNTDGYPDFYSGNHRNYGHMQVYDPQTERYVSGNSADADDNWTRGYAHYDDHGASWADLDNDGDLDLLMSEARGASRWLSNTNGVLSTEVIEGSDGAYAWAHEDGGRDLTANYTGKYRWTVLTDLNNAGRLDRVLVNNDGNFPESVSFQGEGPAVTVPQVAPVIDMIPGDFNGDLLNDYITVVGRDRPNGSYLTDSNTLETVFSISNSSNNQELTIVTDGSLTLHDVNDDAWRGRYNDYQDIRIGSNAYAPASATFTLDVNDPANWGISSSTSSDRLYVGYDTAAGAWKLRFNSTGAWEYLHFYMTTDAPITSFEQPSNNLGDGATHPRLFVNTGSEFQNAGLAIGLDRVQCASGVAGDFDNDMDLDVYMACRNGAANTENVIFENDGNGQFTRIFSHGAEGIVGGSIVDSAGIADSAAVADFDIDGMLDILVVNGMHMRPVHTGGPKQLFKGVENGNNWMMFDLVGTSSNRDGLGAKIYITTPDGKVQYREQGGGHHRWSQNHMRVHVGLGDNIKADIRVEWPSGEVDNYTNLPVRNVFWLEEAGNATVRFSRESVDFDGDGIPNDIDDDDDNDGVLDVDDAFPRDPDESLDTDGDGVGDNADAFPSDPNETADTDGDGVGDNADAFPDDPNEATDSDGDGVGDNADAFPNDPNEVADADGDGLGDNADVDFDNDGLTDTAESRIGTFDKTTDEASIPGRALSSETLIDLSGEGAVIGQQVTVSGIRADGDLNNSNEYFSLSFNDGEFETGDITPDIRCRGSLRSVKPTAESAVTVIDIGGGIPGIKVLGTSSQGVNSASSSCSGVVYSFEISGETQSAFDADGDGLDNGFDLDSDNDGLPDVVEAGLTDADGNFIVDDLLNDQGTVSDPPDSDGDGIPDFLDLESDNNKNDGKSFDIDNTAYAGFDTNGDGQITSADTGGGIDADNDGIDDLIDGNPYGQGGGTPPDADGDGIPDGRDAYPNDGSRSLPELSVVDITVLENLGDALVTVELAVPAVIAGSVDYTSNMGTAVAGSDYTAVTGTLTFVAGEDSRSFVIPILDDTEVEASETLTVDLTNAMDLVIVDNQATITIADDDVPIPLECYEPSFDASAEQAVFVWKLCDGSGQWRLKVSGGGNGSSEYVGSIESLDGFISFAPLSLESNDLLEAVDAQHLAFALNVWSSGVDGLEWLPGANACLSITSPQNVPVLMGQDKVMVDAPVNLDTLTECQVPPPPSYCEAPDYDPATERGVFVWQTCVTGTWNVRVTGGGSNVGLAYTGQVAAADGFASFAPDGLESNDLLNSFDPGTLDFVMNVSGAGEDGFSFSTNDPAGCLTVESPLVPLYLGSDRVQMPGATLNLQTLQPCGTVAPDADNDGLSDADEAFFGTDPLNPDSDAEGLADGLEINVYGTDPLHVNTDRDGINDYVEVQFKGTDPTNPDTDGDGLTDGQEAGGSGLGTDPLNPDTDGGGVNDGDEVNNGTNPFDPADG